MLAELLTAQDAQPLDQLRIVRRDGPSVGPISSNHVISITYADPGVGDDDDPDPPYFSLIDNQDDDTDERWNLALPSVETDLTRLLLLPVLWDRSGQGVQQRAPREGAPLCYEDEYCFTSADCKWRLGFSLENVALHATPMTKNHWSCKLKISPCSGEQAAGGSSSS